MILVLTNFIQIIYPIVNNIILIHLSDGNSNACELQKRIHEATGKTVHFADKGIIININKTPF